LSHLWGPISRKVFKPVNLLICRNFDRAAPLGTGSFKVGGNYAASLRALIRCKGARIFEFFIS